MKLIDRFKALYKKIPAYIRVFISVYLIAISIFFVFRLIFLINGSEGLEGVPFNVVLRSFLVGVWFDIVVTGYCAILPFVLSFISEMLLPNSKIAKKTVFWLLNILLLAAVAINASDIPYYSYYNTRLTVTIFNWFSTPKIVVGMLTENIEYVVYGIVFFAFAVLQYFLLRKAFKPWFNNIVEKRSLKNYIISCIIFLVSGFIMFAGIRGKVSELPIKWSDAYFSIYPFPNQVGLNPVFTLGSSFEQERKAKKFIAQFMDIETAIQQSRNMFGITNSSYSSPIARLENAGEKGNKYNVVLVLMESMTRGFLGSSGRYNPSLTPFLDSLIDQSVFFENIYADGIHTFNGVWATTTSMPSVPDEYCPMSRMENAQQFSGIAVTLLKNGYHTFFACPHDAEFDNMGGFLSLNGYEHITSQLNFGISEYNNTWGVADHVMFNKNFQYLNEMYAKGKPFLGTFLTVSNHGPYKLPAGLPADFKPRGKDAMENVVYYADWSLRQFMEKAKSQPWFDNTIFVFIADHGKNLEKIFEIDYWHKHIPMIFYAPKILKPAKVTNWGGQQDMFPTLMSILKIPYVNNTMGINLFQNDRKFMYCSANYAIAALDSSYMYIRFKDGRKALYDYKNKIKTNLYETKPEYGKYYENYARAIYETELWMIKNKKVGFIKP